MTLIDPIAPGGRDQTSFGNAGLLARTSVVPLATPAMVKSAPKMLFDPDAPLFLRWRYLPRLLPWLLPFLKNANPERAREIARSLAPFTFDTHEQHLTLAKGTAAEAHIRSGEFLTLYRSRSDYESGKLAIDIRRENGIVPEYLDRRDILDRDPHIAEAYAFATVFKDFGWISSPGAYLAALFDHFRQQGGQFRNARVVELKPGPRPTATLEGGETVEGDKIVLSAGAWSGKLARTSGVRVNLDTERGYHISMRNPSFTAPQPYMVSDLKFILTPMDDTLRAAGVVEFGGVDAPASKAPVDLLLRGIRKVYPDLEYESVDSWLGRRPSAPDSLPIVGESAKAPNILHAYGGQHIGLTIGPKIGRLICNLASGRNPNLDISPYEPDRF